MPITFKPDYIASNASNASNASSPGDVRPRAIDRLSEMGVSALVDLRSTVDGLAYSMRSARRSDTLAVDQRSVSALQASYQEDWQPIIDAERSDLAIRFEGQVDAQNSVRSFNTALGLNVRQLRANPESNLHEVIVNALRAGVPQSMTAGEHFTRLELSLLKVIGQFYYGIPNASGSQQGAPLPGVLEPESRTFIENKDELKDDARFCALNKLRALVGSLIYKQEEMSESSLAEHSSLAEQEETLQFTTSEARALYDFLDEKLAAKNMRALSNQMVALSSVERALTGANARATEPAPAAMADESSVSVNAGADAGAQGKKRSATEAGVLGVIDRSAESRPLKKRWLERANNSGAFNSFENHLDQTESAIPANEITQDVAPKNIESRFHVAPWLNPEAPGEVARSYAGKKPKLENILIPEKFVNNKTLEKSIFRAVDAFYKKSYVEQDKTSRSLIDVTRVGDDVLLEGPNEALRGQFGGAAGKDIVLKPGKALCLGLYRGVLIDSAESEDAFWKANPQCSDRLDQYTFNLLLDEVPLGDSAEKRYTPSIVPLMDGTDGDDLVGVLPYINTYTEVDAQGKTRTSAERVNVQGVSVQTSTGRKNDLFDAVAYVIINDSDETLTLEKGTHFFVDYGQNYVDMHLSGQKNQELSRYSGQFPLNFLTKDGAIVSHNALARDGDYKLLLLEDSAIVEYREVGYVAKALNRRNKSGIDWAVVKNNAEHSLTLSEADRFALLQEKVALSNNRNDIRAKAPIKKGEAFILPGFSYQWSDRSAAAKAVSTEKKTVSEQDLDRDSFELDLLGNRMEAKERIEQMLGKKVYLSKDGQRFQKRDGRVNNEAEALFKHHKYLFASCGDYSNFLIDIPDTSDEQTGNMDIIMARSNVAASSEPPDCVIFYAMRDIEPGEALFRFVR